MVMASGYTHPVAEREDYTLREFLWSCLGAFVYDCGGYPTLKRVQVPEGAIEEELESWRLKLREYEAMSDAELEELIATEHAEITRAYTQAREEMRQKLDRVRKMQAEVQAWARSADPVLADLKNFALSQLQETIDHNDLSWAVPPLRDVNNERAQKVRHCRRMIEDVEARLLTVRERNRHWADVLEKLEASCPRPKELRPRD